MEEKLIHALEVFSRDIYKILKVNLKEDSYEIIKSDQQELQEEKPKISEWISFFAKTGQVYTNDVELYKHYTNLDALRNYFKTHKNGKYRLRYRRKFGKDFRWVVLEIIPDKAYSAANPIVYLYVYDDSNQMSEPNNQQIELVRQLREQMMTNDIVRGMMKLATWATRYDGEGNETSINYSEDFKLLLGYDEDDEFPDVLESWINRVHPDDIERVLGEQKSAAEDYSGVTKFDSKYRMQLKNGDYHWFRSSGSYSRWSDGIPYYFSGIFIDLDDTNK